jgi:hypothetical protein
VKDYPIVELLVSGFQLLVGALLPFLVISGCNITIIITVKLASENRNKMEACQGQRKRKESEYLTRMLVLVSVAYVVTSAPFRLYYLIIDVPAVSKIYDMTNEYWILRFNAQNEFLYDVWCCNYAFNFYLYCVGGGQRYRKDTVEILRGLVHCFRKQTIVI